MPASYTALGLTPAFILDSTSHSNVDWQLISGGTGPLQIQANVSGGGWNTVFEFKAGAANEHRSFRDIVIERSTSPAVILDNTSSTASISYDGTDVVSDKDVKISNGSPKLVLEDTSTSPSHDDFTIGTDSDVFFIEVDDGTTAFNVLESKDGYVYAPQGIASGEGSGSGTDQILKWKIIEETVGTTSPKLVDTGVNGVVGAFVMMTTGTQSDTATFDLYDWRYSAGDPDGFHVQVDRGGAASGNDELEITFSTSRYNVAAGLCQIVVFYAII